MNSPILLKRINKFIGLEQGERGGAGAVGVLDNMGEDEEQPTGRIARGLQELASVFSSGQSLTSYPVPATYTSRWGQNQPASASDL